MKGGRAREKEKKSGEFLSRLERLCAISISRESHIKPCCLDVCSLICLFSINTEKRAFSHVNTQITVTEGAIKLRTSGLLFVSHKSRVSLKNTHKHKQTDLYAHMEGPHQGSLLPLSHRILVSNTSNTNTHAVRSDYTEL